jgi:hypothetical protein
VQGFVSERARPSQERASSPVGLLLLTAIVVAIVCTIAVAALWYAEASAAPPPTPGTIPREGPPPGGARRQATLVVVVGIATVAWTSVIIIAARDQVLRHLDVVSRRLADAGRELIMASEELGVFRGMKIEERRERPEDERPSGARPPRPDITGGPGHPMGFSPGRGPAGGTGHVLPFPLSPRDED